MENFKSKLENNKGKLSLATIFILGSISVYSLTSEDEKSFNIDEENKKIRENFKAFSETDQSQDLQEDINTKLIETTKKVHNNETKHQEKNKNEEKFSNFFADSLKNRKVLDFSLSKPKISKQTPAIQCMTLNIEYGKQLKHLKSAIESNFLPEYKHLQGKSMEIKVVNNTCTYPDPEVQHASLSIGNLFESFGMRSKYEDQYELGNETFMQIDDEKIPARGTRCPEFTNTEDVKTCRNRYILKAVEHEEILNKRLNSEDKRGREHWIRVSKLPLYNDLIKHLNRNLISKNSDFRGIYREHLQIHLDFFSEVENDWQKHLKRHKKHKE